MQQSRLISPILLVLLFSSVTYSFDPETSNAGLSVAGMPNAATFNAQILNAGSPSAGTPNAGIPRGRTSNAGSPNAGSSNAGSPNTGSSDSELRPWPPSRWDPLRWDPSRWPPSTRQVPGAPAPVNAPPTVPPPVPLIPVPPPAAAPNPVPPPAAAPAAQAPVAYDVFLPKEMELLGQAKREINPMPAFYGTTCFRTDENGAYLQPSMKMRQSYRDKHNQNSILFNHWLTRRFDWFPLSIRAGQNPALVLDGRPIQPPPTATTFTRVHSYASKELAVYVYTTDAAGKMYDVIRQPQTVKTPMHSGKAILDSLMKSAQNFAENMNKIGTDCIKEGFGGSLHVVDPDDSNNIVQIHVTQDPRDLTPSKFCQLCYHRLQENVSTANVFLSVCLLAGSLSTVLICIKQYFPHIGNQKRQEESLWTPPANLSVNWSV